MNYICPVCKSIVDEGATKCKNCGFTDKLGINRVWLNEEDAKCWLETVVKPYRTKIELEEKNKKIIENEHGQCNVSAWHDIRPVSEEQILKWKQANVEREKRKAKEAEGSRQKAEQEAKERAKIKSPGMYSIVEQV